MTDLALAPVFRPELRLASERLTQIAMRWATRLNSETLPGDLVKGQPSVDRWYRRLDRNSVFEVYLEGWDGDQRTDFHNHGGSSGAVLVIAGELIDVRPTRQRNLRAGDRFAFGEDIIHDIRNGGNGPSLSVHVYSPPLTTQTFFDRSGDELVERETVHVDGPELGALELAGVW